MKKLIGMIALCGFFSIGASAQSLSTGSGRLQTSGSIATSSTERMEASAATTSTSAMSLYEMERRSYHGRDRKYNEITREDLPYNSPQYDTSKNNGHCQGCGSGALTDPHPWQ